MRALFIGNSHTYCNAMPFQCREMARSRGTAWEVEMVTTGGVTLGWHAMQAATQMAIAYQDNDAIVLQQKTHPYDGHKQLLRDLTALNEWLRRSRARVFLCNTWCEKVKPENQRKLDRSFRKGAEHFGFGLIPVAQVWHRVEEERPDLDLYDVDGEHANPIGSYLAAVTTYSFVTGEGTEGLPSRIEIGGDVVADVPPDVAQLIQRTVDAVRKLPTRLTSPLVHGTMDL